MASAASASTSPLSALEYDFSLAESISVSDMADDNIWVPVSMPGASPGPGSSVGAAFFPSPGVASMNGSMSSWTFVEEQLRLQQQQQQQQQQQHRHHQSQDLHHHLPQQQQPHHQQPHHQHQHHNSSVSVAGSGILRGMVLSPSPVVASPLSLDFGEHASTYVAGAGAGSYGPGALSGLDLTTLAASPVNGSSFDQLIPVSAAASGAATNLQDMSLSPELYFNDQQLEAELAALFQPYALVGATQQTPSQQGWNFDIPQPMAPQMPQVQQQAQPKQPQQPQQIMVQTPLGASDPSSPWSSRSLVSAKAGESTIFVMESPNSSTTSPSQHVHSPVSSLNHSSPSVQNFHTPSASPAAAAAAAAAVGQGGLQSPLSVKQQLSASASLAVDSRKAARGSTAATTTPITIRKVRGQNSRINKNAHQSPVDLSLTSNIAAAAATAAAVTITRDSVSPNSATSCGSRFVIVTPDSVSAHAGRPNPFECFEAMRPSQRGRKGPLAVGTKASALQVRRQGACFCCHARKVKCDKERPCRNCKKLTVAVPQVICWQFQDFLPVLFPDFIRGHFRKDDMAAFVVHNIASFTVDGAERPCAVELSSGPRFCATLALRAKFFTAKTDEVLRHWTGSALAANDLRVQAAAPIGLEMTDPHAAGANTGNAGSPSKASSSSSSTGAHGHRDELRRKVRQYVHDIVAEPGFAELVTEPLVRQTQIPRRVLRIVQNYARRCESPLVRRALDIYAMHFVMTQHLCLTRRAAAALTAAEPTLMPRGRGAWWVTPRVLNRQIKAAVDELLQREVQQLFDAFSRSLKPKSRREWGPCAAAFLVLCLFMEAVESAAEGFAAADNEVEARAGRVPTRRRAFPLGIVRDVDNLPFRQFAWQFHQVYATHSRDAAARSFNPLLDNPRFEGDGASGAGAVAELDSDAAEMVWQLRELVQDRECWSELDFLSADPIVPNPDYPFERHMTFNYTGRLVSKFLLSFTDERYIFGTA